MDKTGRDETKITPRQQRLIEALLASQTVCQACAAAGVPRQTYYRWLRQGAFREALRQAEAEVVAEAMRRLLALQGAAVDALSDLVADHRMPGARLQAAKAILDAALRLRDVVALESRLAELEQKLDEVLDERRKTQTD